MAQQDARYIPAAEYDLFLPFYDPALRLFMRDKVFRQRFLEQANILPGQRVLDVGCGTGTMAILVRRQVPEAIIVGVDGDPKALAVARTKAEKQKLSIQFDEALADRLPYADGSFDRVLTSLVFHHLTHEGKLNAFREVRRILKPGGCLHFADFGPPVGRYARFVAWAQSSNERLHENQSGSLTDLMVEAGFQQVEKHGYHNTLFGTIVLLSAMRETANGEGQPASPARQSHSHFN